MHISLAGQLDRISLREKVFSGTKKGRMSGPTKRPEESGSEESYWCRRLIRFRLEIALDHHTSQKYTVRR